VQGGGACRLPRVGGDRDTVATRIGLAFARYGVLGAWALVYITDTFTCRKHRPRRPFDFTSIRRSLSN